MLVKGPDFCQKKSCPVKRAGVWAMKRSMVFLFAAILFLFFSHANAADDAGKWVEMPAGGKPAYLGIHGGTMPVSLLVTGDGAALLTFVGRTGNDFLEALRQAGLPSLGNSTHPVSLPAITADGKASLFAGNATASLPVITLSGDVLSRQEWFQDLEPFGLSAMPLSIEGKVAKPNSPISRYRVLFLPDSFRLNKH